MKKVGSKKRGSRTFDDLPLAVGSSQKKRLLKGLLVKELLSNIMILILNARVRAQMKGSLDPNELDIFWWIL